MSLLLPTKPYVIGRVPPLSMLAAAYGLTQERGSQVVARPDPPRFIPQARLSMPCEAPWFERWAFAPVCDLHRRRRRG